MRDSQASVWVVAGVVPFAGREAWFGTGKCRMVGFGVYGNLGSSALGVDLEVTNLNTSEEIKGVVRASRKR